MSLNDNCLTEFAQQVLEVLLLQNLFGVRCKMINNEDVKISVQA